MGVNRFSRFRDGSLRQSVCQHLFGRLRLGRTWENHVLFFLLTAFLEFFRALILVVKSQIDFVFHEIPFNPVIKFKDQDRYICQRFQLYETIVSKYFP